MLTDVVDLVGHLPFPIGVTAGPDHVVELLDPTAYRLLGSGLVVGTTARASLPVGDAVLAALDRAYREGEPSLTGVGPAAVTVGCVPIRDPDGSVAGVLLHVVGEGHDGLELIDAARARRRSSALQQLATELSRAATPSAIGALCVTAAVEVLHADAAGAYASAGPGRLEVLHSVGWPEATRRQYEHLVLQHGRPLSDAVLDGEPVWIEDAEQWRLRYPEMAPVGTSGGFQATACIPFRVEDRDLGAAVFTFARPRAFTTGERGHLLAVAALCAQALDRARLLVAEQAARAAAEQQRDRMTFLARAGRLMEAPLSVQERLRQLADLAVPTIADWCAVHLVRDDRVDRIAVAHADPAKVRFVDELQHRYPPDPHAPGGAIQVARTGVPVHLRDIPDEMLVAAAVDEAHLDILRGIGMRSAVVVPLVVRDTRLGALTLVHAESGNRFDETDLAFAQQLAATAALALDNARLFEQQQAIARTLQSALLPRSLPAMTGLELAARYVPQAAHPGAVQVGGDLYDVVPGRDRCAVTVADVCGKGTEAAALTALIRHTVRAEVDHGVQPAEVLRRLNAAMLREPGTDPARFATVVHAQLVTDVGGASVRLTSGGHEPPLVLRAGGVEVLDAPGTLLGVYPEIDLVEVDVRLAPGEVLVLYTDGVTEAHGVDGLYGPDRLAAVVAECAGRSAESVAEAVLSDVAAFRHGPPRDDVVLLVVRAAP
ncbi:SpoIIE family protein phosphatase [Pseudonocardia sp. KRD-184]|uniref:SpoIIE family protein phosphatase n=1 Tax=Pseudonocardia oceani TaxID=2792013 RepID=A0ABS6U3E6_9PSEU|nr:SpoIIE family protein phosphatase [Pseudonocardia oceani]MBW0089055.1 SpoIIE family protein phosphatase [Pseudonocardia oceani]MBW0094688.1 SpoIIE family protein phosphatase [Pseudonocardia oceani]MBW0107235.1 SpoIIE family protein phosphatase [Pseudonocardia oceani]MBW0119790.1 SpoIIE family protein phosphatase [Pseudonocardia oceani]MBW0126694.1 SpoIIE family protein phosphatase [Pseudonocardia oceani]